MMFLTPENKLFRNGAAHRIVRYAEGILQLENQSTLLIESVPFKTLLEEFCDKKLRVNQNKAQMRASSSPSVLAPLEQVNLSDPARAATRRAVNFIIKLENRGAFEKRSRNNLCTAIAEVARELGEAVAPHETTVYRWYKEYLEAGRDVRALISMIQRRGGKGKSRLHPIVDVIIDEKLDMVFLKSKNCSAEEIHDSVFLAIQQENTTRIESEWLQIPSLRTIQRRIADIFGYEIAVAKYGRKEADRRYAFILRARPTTRILELVEIDHTPVDIIVVDKNRVAIGRPDVTFVLDRHSRCVLGFNLSLAGHGTSAVFDALRHALMPKTYLDSTYPDLKLVWECFGWFELLLMDNGPEFHAYSVADALINVGVPTEFAESREPNDKPFIERFNRTFNYCFIHRLPGTTLAKIHQRIGFKAEKDACLTLEELERLIHVWILDYYHLRPHAGLKGRAPIDVWRENAKSHPPVLKANVEQLEIEFSEAKNSAVQHYGIDLNTYRYNSVDLVNLRRMLPIKGARVDVKAPSHDVGHIYVWNPFEKEYFMVPNVDPSYDGLTLEQAKAADKAIEASDSYKSVRANAGDVAREIVESAERDKTLKGRKKGARMANKTSKTMRQPKAAPKPTASAWICESPDNASPIVEFVVETII